MSIIIRPATIDDAAMLRDLSITTFVDTFSHVNDKEHMDQYIATAMNMEQILSELNDVENKFFLAYIQDTPVGFTKMRTKEIPEELAGSNPIEIERIYVSKDHHGQKIGAALMRHCIDYAMGNSYNAIWLGVWEHNQKAIDFYTRWGFTFFSSHIFMLGTDAQTDVLMKKELKP
jgi:diamine N-acetyltransferase